ncbi:MAG: FAD-linked oxidase, partial [Actinomycetota bacterium]
EYGNQVVSPITSVGVWQMGGAVARVAEEETAFNGRGAGHTFNLAGGTESAAGFEEEREWARSYWSALSPYHASVYVNFLMDEGQERIQEAYGPAKYERLRALRSRFTLSS